MSALPLIYAYVWLTNDSVFGANPPSFGGSPPGDILFARATAAQSFEAHTLSPSPDQNPSRSVPLRPVNVLGAYTSSPQTPSLGGADLSNIQVADGLTSGRACQSSSLLPYLNDWFDVNATPQSVGGSPTPVVRLLFGDTELEFPQPTLVACFVYKNRDSGVRRVSYVGDINTDPLRDWQLKQPALDPHPPRPYGTDEVRVGSIWIFREKGVNECRCHILPCKGDGIKMQDYDRHYETFHDPNHTDFWCPEKSCGVAVCRYDQILTHYGTRHRDTQPPSKQDCPRCPCHRRVVPQAS